MGRMSGRRRRRKIYEVEAAAKKYGGECSSYRKKNLRFLSLIFPLPILTLSEEIIREEGGKKQKKKERGKKQKQREVVK